MNYLEETVAKMRTDILTALGSYFASDVKQIDEDTVQEIDKILTDNLKTSFKNGLEAGKKPRGSSARRK
jgi:hypothetical protein